MEANDLRDMESIFAQVEDPRMERTRLHRLRDIIILAICGVLCGADGWVEIEEFGKAKEAFFTESAHLAQWDSVPRYLWTGLCLDRPEAV